MPKKPSPNDIDLFHEKEIVQRLHAERKRTGVSFRKLSKALDGTNNKRAEHRIQNILKGQVRFASKAEIDILLWAYSRFPSAERIRLTPSRLSKIENLMREKNVSFTQISRSLPRYLKLDRNVLRSWFEGRARSTLRANYETVIAFLKDYTPAPPKLKIYEIEQQPGFSEITPEYIERLQWEIKRTGIPPAKMLLRFNERRIKAATINAWIAGRIKSARPESMNIVIELYAKTFERN